VSSVLDSNFKNSEVIVVDNGSTDGTFEVLSQSFPQIKLVRSEENLGVCGGRNLGLKHASNDSKYILFLDHDIHLEKNALVKLLEVAEADPKVGIVTGKIYYSDDPTIIWAAGTSINLVTGKIAFNGGKDDGQFDQVKDVQVAPSIIFTRKKLLDKIGGFDESLFATYEDTDFCFRARQAGYKVVYTPQARAYHSIPLDHWKSMERLLSSTYFIARNRIIFMKRYSPHFLLFVLFIPAYFLYYTVLSLRHKRFDGIANFLKGTISGIREAFR
jgi:GT2 family glycosyltransferase